MLKILKPFFKYNSALAFALALYYILVKFAPDDLAINYTILVYFPILLLIAPILFGIWYGYRLSHNHILSLKKLLQVCFIIIIFSCITYYIPFYEWIFINPPILPDLHPLAFFPTTLLIITFCSSIIINQHRNKNYK